MIFYDLLVFSLISITQPCGNVSFSLGVGFIVEKVKGCV